MRSITPSLPTSVGKFSAKVCFGSPNLASAVCRVAHFENLPYHRYTNGKIFCTGKKIGKIFDAQNHQNTEIFEVTST